MKKWAKIAALAALCTGIWLLCCGFVSFRFRGGSIDGLDLRGLTPAAAEKTLRDRYERELRQKNLIIDVAGREYVFTYPELDYRSDLTLVIRRAREQRGDYTVARRYFLHGQEEILQGICQNYAQRARAAQVKFTAEFKDPFVYSEGRGAQYVDYELLKRDVEHSLASDLAPITAQTLYSPEKYKVSDLKRERTRLSCFTTYFSADNAPRAHNIALAAQKLNGCVLAAGEEFSFNERVGDRTEANGFLSAPIILEGDFVEGVGGGVCQASTTVYNAALLAGMQITEQHPHSLRVGYVEPSFDAMVSGKFCDLRFRNGSGKNVYILCKAEKGSISVAFYGEESDIEYVRKSVIKEELIPPPAEEVEGEEEKVIRAEKTGLVSEGYLIAYRNGKPVSTRKIRKDKYASVQGILQKKAAEQKSEKSVAYWKCL